MKTENHTMQHLWTVFGVIGTLYNLGLISASTYVSLLLINDLLAKIVVICHYNNNIMQIEMSHQDIDIDTYKILVQFKNMMKDKLDNSSLMKINEYIHQVLYTRIPMHTESNSQNTVLSSIKTNMIDKVVPNDIDDRMMLELIEEPKTLNDVVVLFTDVVGYSRICKHHSSIEIMETLDELYSNYDQCIETLPELYKIENIGDCYMITSSNIIGRKYQNHEVLHSFLKFSREILDISTKMEIDIRIGIHVGSVTVGIIGSINPRFGVVGNTVNIAARLESTCVINNLHVSVEFYEKIKEYLKKGMVISNTELKNIGIKKTVHIQADDFELNNDNNS
jgi:class 3 adenylate cyclase